MNNLSIATDFIYSRAYFLKHNLFFNLAFLVIELALLAVVFVVYRKVKNRGLKIAISILVISIAAILAVVYLLMDNLQFLSLLSR